MFSNKPNTFVKNDTGKICWISRSVAVVSVVKWTDKFLITQRGKGISCPGKWCVPCGYLDWDENASECVKREIYEETGINLDNFKYTGLESPYDVITDPSNNRKQDIAMHFAIEILSDTQPEINFDVIDEKETVDVRWINIEDIDQFDFAFNHIQRIKKFANG